MIAYYLIGQVVTFFGLIFLVRKFNSKLEIYDNGEDDKTAVVLTIVLISVFWLITIPVLTILGFFALVVKNSTRLLDD